ncbi:uncharacterized protein L3040_006935 [Drepanopeziza brunnea f. sp. 'multigermtubi']|uniref:uncharacterized protein n=1 Tax=Drepanopeziza brunnea f. sp. 'multigermtubi' TaxID=698441 RepID=UPI00238E7DF7|nr:hypothetical protein L3040_006935 [Drepanopeziza brunnea f. sp. 'multigermtubi']
MSRIRGLIPIVLAGGLGIGNGLWVFGPEITKQLEEKKEQEKKALELVRQSENEPIESLQKAEAAASRTIATEAALKPEKSASWLPSWIKQVNKPLGKDAMKETQKEAPEEPVKDTLEAPKNTP